MAIFNSYVKLPEGKSHEVKPSDRSVGVGKLQAHRSALFCQGRTGVDQQVLMAGPQQI